MPLGILLAAGGGTRMGRPKALVHDELGRSWLAHTAGTLVGAGCARVLVVLGAELSAARALLPSDPRFAVVEVDDWRSGLSASLAAGLRAAQKTDATAVVITLVDLPGLPVAVITRMLAEIAADPATTLCQASYRGDPGHPVVIGRQHWTPLIDILAGDTGGRSYLLGHGVVAVECGDLWHGRDVDSYPASAPSPA
ncbi:MAG: nucleotidyltransferase family protein [Microbacteriaceae bacterium]|nr:nucleotidyltransferase family protein [Microbacteriaceae bacterium]